MTGQELVERRLAGATYEELGRLSGLSEGAVWKVLRGKVPGRGRKAPVAASVRESELSRRAISGPKTAGEYRNKGPLPGSPHGSPYGLLLAAWGDAFEGIDRVAIASGPYDFDPGLRGPEERLKGSVMAALDAKVAAAETPGSFAGHWHKAKVGVGACLPCDRAAGRPVPDWFEKSLDWFKPWKERPVKAKAEDV